MKRVYFLIFILVALSISNKGISQFKVDSTYIEYHKAIIEAEKKIFLNSEIKSGLLLFAQTFKRYDYLFVDDCLEAFQLALFYKMDSLATYFIHRAIDNGFQIHLLDNVQVFDPKKLNTYADKRYITIYNAYLSQNENALKKYQAKAFNTYIKKINKKLLQKLINRHIKEQIYKQCATGISVHENESIYQAALQSNFNYIYSLLKNNMFIGEQSVGYLSNALLKSLNIKYLENDRFLNDSILSIYNLKENTYVPVTAETESSDYSIVTILLHHNNKHIKRIETYLEKGIRFGQFHPREIAYIKTLKNNLPKSLNSENCRTDAIGLDSYFEAKKNTDCINSIRKKLLIPPYEVDYAKYKFEQENNIKLIYGFLKSTR